MSDRFITTLVAVGIVFAFIVVVGGYQFLYWAFFDPNVPYLPEGSDGVVLFVTATIGGAIAFVFGIVTAVVTSRIAGRAAKDGRDAALSMPGQPPVGGARE